MFALFDNSNFKLIRMSQSEQLEQVRKTFVLDAKLADKLEKDAFWNRKSIKDVLKEILDNHYQSKEFEDYPSTYKKPAVGRKKK